MAVAKDRSCTVEQSAFGISARGHHRALNVNMRVDETRRKDTAVGIVNFRLRANAFRGLNQRHIRTRRLHGGNAAGFDPDLTIGMNALGVSREQAAAGDDKVGCLAAHRDGAERAGDGV